MRGYIRAALVMAACAAGGTVLMAWLSLTDIAMLHLIGVGVVASRATRRQAAFAALLSVALFDFFFVPPRFAFTVADLHYVVTFGVMLVTALVISWLAQRVREEAVATEVRDRGTAALSPLSAELLGTDTSPLRLRAGVHVGEAVVSRDDLVGHVVNVAARVTEALERPSRMWPVSGIETSAPAAMHSRHSPSVAFEIPRWSCSHGMCATQVPIIAPLIAKTVNVARRGVIRPPRRCRRSYTGVSARRCRR